MTTGTATQRQGVPAWYVCDEYSCRATGVRLWRDSGFSSIELLCVRCMLRKVGPAAAGERWLADRLDEVDPNRYMVDIYLPACPHPDWFDGNVKCFPSVYMTTAQDVQWWLALPLCAS